MKFSSASLGIICAIPIAVAPVRAEQWVTLYREIDRGNQWYRVQFDLASVYRRDNIVFAKIRYWTEGLAKPWEPLAARAICVDPPQYGEYLGGHAMGAVIQTRQSNGRWHFKSNTFVEKSESDKPIKRDLANQMHWDFLCKNILP